MSLYIFTTGGEQFILPESPISLTKLIAVTRLWHPYQLVAADNDELISEGGVCALSDY